MQDEFLENRIDAGNEETGQRSFIRIFLYPCSRVGLARIALIWFVIVAMTVLVRFVSFVMPVAGGLVFFAAGFFIGADFLFYLANCVRSSADGAQIASDDIFAFQGGLPEIVQEFCRLILPYLVCFVPSMLYMAITERQDGWYWGMLAAGCFYFPMFMLAVILFDSPTGLNPFLHLVSIFSAFFSYCLLVVQVLLIAALFVLAVFLLDRLPFAAFLILPLQLYFMILFAHLLGRFYYFKEEKLRWSV